MQFTAASVLAILATIVADCSADDHDDNAQYRFPVDEPFTATVLSFDGTEGGNSAIHYHTIGAANGRLIIDNTIDLPGTKSSRGNVNPIFQNGNGTLSTWSSNPTTAQQIYIDIAVASRGLLSFSKPGASLDQPQINDQFNRNYTDTEVGSLYFGGQDWIACSNETGRTLLFNVYAKAEYGQSASDGCYDFQIRTDRVDPADLIDTIYY